MKVIPQVAARARFVRRSRKPTTTALLAIGLAGTFLRIAMLWMR